MTITDANGCTTTANANVGNSGGATITASVQQDVLCNNGNTGSATVNVQGGVGPFTYLWSPLGGTGATANNLPAGNYTITVTGSNGCISTDNITITEPAARLLREQLVLTQPEEGRWRRVVIITTVESWPGTAHAERAAAGRVFR